MFLNNLLLRVTAQTLVLRITIICVLIWVVHFFQIVSFSGSGGVTQEIIGTLKFYTLLSLTVGCIAIMFARQYHLLCAVFLLFVVSSFLLSVFTNSGMLLPIPLRITGWLNIIGIITTVISGLVVYYEFFENKDSEDDEISDEEMMDSDIFTKTWGEKK